jgi:hypothetical protein
MFSIYKRSNYKKYAIQCNYILEVRMKLSSWTT